MIKLKCRVLLLGIAATGLTAGYAHAAPMAPTTEIMQLEDGLSAVRYDGDSGLIVFCNKAEPQMMQAWLIF